MLTPSIALVAISALQPGVADLSEEINLVADHLVPLIS
jgi:hypothetical protein